MGLLINSNDSAITWPGAEISGFITSLSSPQALQFFVNTHTQKHHPLRYFFFGQRWITMLQASEQPSDFKAKRRIVKFSNHYTFLIDSKIAYSCSVEKKII